MDIAAFLYYFGIFIVMSLSAFGVAYGQGIAGAGSMSATTRQLLAHLPVRRSLLLGVILIESGGIFALVLSLAFVLTIQWVPTVASGLAVLGACIGMGISSCIVGIASGRVVSAATQAMARHPFDANKIRALMVLTQGLLEAPAIFAFIIGIFVYSSITPDMTLTYGLQLCISGLFIAFCSIGPAIGQALFSAGACEAVGLNIQMYPRIFQFSMVTQALIETPIIFGLLLALMIMMRSIITTPLIQVSACLLGAVLAFGLGSIGAAVGSGYMSARAVRGMARQPDQYSILFRIALFCQTIIDTALIYSFIIAVSLILRCV